MGSTPVMGDERPRRPSGEQVAEDAEGERQQALGDPLDQSGDGLGEVLAESQLALEVGEHRLDDEANTGLFKLGRRSFAEAVALGGDELDAEELERALELAPPKPLSQDAGGLAAGEHDHRFAFLARFPTRS